MFFKRPELAYSLTEFVEYTKMSEVEKIIYDFSKHMDNLEISIKKHEKIFRTITCTFAIFLSIEKVVYADAPSTGFDTLDNGAWKMVKTMQACVFWFSLFYTFRALLLVTVKGEGEWKNVATGFLICVCDYLLPWLFGLVPNLFLF